MFDNLQRAIASNQRNRRVDKMPSNGKYRLLRRKFNKHFISALQNKPTQTSGSAFAERIEEAKKTEFEKVFLLINFSMVMVIMMVI